MNDKVMASLIIKVFALICMFLLALVYDGMFISIFFLVGGILLGVDMAHIIKMK